jgi:hypothetical protein
MTASAAEPDENQRWPLRGARVLVVPNEFPLPANTGGRVDVWRRLQQIKALGAEVALLTWYDGPRDGRPGPELLAQLATVCAEPALSAITRQPPELLRRLVWTGRLPSHAASRWVTLDRAAVLAWARQFQPTVILLDGLYGFAVVRWLSQTLGVPWVYRAHNIEHRYMRDQQSRAVGWPRRLGLLANLWGLERMERAALQGARTVLDISPDDAETWRQAGVAQVQCLPTVVDAAYAAALQSGVASEPRWDLLYFGNLNTPNNVEAVRWLVQAVWPALQAAGWRVALAGSRPNAEVRELAAQHPGLGLLADPPDMAAVVRQARVLINPVLAGSGVNLKSVEMLFSTARLVATPAGVQGLTAQAKACFDVRSDAQGLIEALQQALARGPLTPADVEQRVAARQVYAPARAAQVLVGALGLATAPAGGLA